MDNCPECLLRRQLEQIRAKQERNRQELKICWVSGGLVNGTKETTVVKIDCHIPVKLANKLMSLLTEIEASFTEDQTQ